MGRISLMTEFARLAFKTSLRILPLLRLRMRIALLLTLALTAQLSAAPIPDDAYQNGLVIGCQAFKEFSAFEAIAKTKESGGKLIEFYPGHWCTSNLKPPGPSNREGSPPKTSP